MSIRSLGLLAAFVCLAQAVFAQATGRITGSVLDPAGGVIAGASVLLTNTDTGIKQETRTNGEGLFRFPEIPIGKYSVTVSSAGLKTLVRSGIELLTAQTLDVAIHMELGAVAESIEVTGAAALVQSTTSSVQTSVDTRQMEDLPLDGRNPLQLVVLTPGALLTNVQTTTGQQDNQGVAVNGARSDDNNYRLDGGKNTNAWFGSAPVLPNPDTLQEFTVQSSTYSARNSGGGAVVELSTRSGTNQFHGVLFEFLRNEKFNASDVVSRSVAPFKRSQYGGTIGGPLRRNRTFFFGSYQATRERASPVLKVLTPPSAAECTGDFSSRPANPVVDPASGAPFPGNIVPSSRLDPIVLKLMDKAVPLPNNGNRFVFPAPADKDDDQGVIKIDHLFSPRNQISGRYFHDRYNFQRDTNSVPGIFGDNFFYNRSLTVRDTHTFTPSFVMTVTATYARFFRDQFPRRQLTLREAGVQYPLAREVADPAKEGVRFNVTGFFQLFSGGALTQQPETQDYRVSGYYTRGGHVVQFGVDLERNNDYQLDASGFEGDFTFNGSRTSSPAIRGSGIALADAFLSLPSAFTQNSGKSNRLHENRYHPWIQDDWKISRGLTLNLGLRWEPWLPPIDRDGTDRDRLVGFLPGFRSTVSPVAPAGIVLPGDGDYPASLVRNDWNNLAPRVGAAWDVFHTGRTVLRGGYGIFFKTIQDSVFAKATEVQPYALLVSRTDLVTSIANPYIGYPGGSPYPYRAPKSLADIKFTFPISGQIIDPTIRSGYLQNWNLAVEQALPGSVVLTVSYVGNHAVKLLGDILVSPAVYGPGATVANQESRRLYPGFSQLITRSPFGFANYHSMQIQARRRAARGLTLLANYVWGKAIDNVSTSVANNSVVRNPFNPNIDRAPSDIDVTHNAKFAIVYSLPGIQGSTRLVRGVLNGWQTNAIASLRSGLPLRVVSGRDNSLSANNLDHPDVIGDSARPAGADPQEQWFNNAAFVQNAPGTFGNAGRNIVRSPGNISVDLSLFKNFTLHEAWKIQFRGEAYNSLNHPNLGSPTVSLNNLNFGRVLVGGSPRVIQLALKLIF
jgi:hypothetical protein